MIQDLRFAVRTLWKSPGFTLVAAVTLALGIGANTAIFSVVDGVLLRPLPYPDPDRLFTMVRNLSAPELEDLEIGTRSFGDMGGAALQPFDLNAGAEPVQGSAALVSGGLLEALGARAVVGRPLSHGDDREGGDRLVVLGHGIWQREFAGDRSIVGRSIRIAGLPYTVVGVLGPDFSLPEQKADLFLPIRVAYPSAAQARGVHFLRTVFRLRPGVTRTAARADLAAALGRLARLHPEHDKGIEADLVPLIDRVVGDSRLPLAILVGAVGLVLLIACANLANLQLARVTGREPELAIRSALGASRPRLVRQILAEGALLSVLGGGLGLLLATWGTGALLSRFPEALPRLDNVTSNARVAAFTLGLSLVTSLVFGLAPAWRASSGRRPSLLGGSRGAGLRTSGRGRGLLVVSEIALALVLLIGSGLLLRALWRLQSVRPGFEADGVLAAHVDLPASRYEPADSQTAFRRRALDALNAQPGVRAAMISELPLSGDALDHDFVIDGWQPVAPGDEPSIYSRSVMGDYFGMMRIPLRAGRALEDGDVEGSALVGVVNESMAKRYFPSSSPLGRRFRWARQPDAPWITIVGVVGDVHHFGLGVDEEPAVYTPYAQAPQPWKRWSEIVVQGPGGPSGLTALVRRQLRGIDSLLPIARPRPMDEVVGGSLARQRFNAELLAAFAGAALVLACVGVFGVMWNLVRQRRAEIGVRIALGAAPSRVVREVLRDGSKLIALGIGLGLAAALGLTRLMSSLLFGVPAADPATFAVVALLLSGAALLACWIPARLAANVDPMTSLRAE
jgi:predicted permease